MKLLKSTFSICLFLLVMAGMVNSQTFPTNLGDVSEWDVFVINEGRFSSSDAEGRVAIGGNAYFYGYDVGAQLSSLQTVLIVGDTLNYTTGNVYNGDVVYANGVNSTGLNIPNGSLSQGNPLNFSDLALSVADVSRQWKLVPTNGTVDVQAAGIFLTGSDPLLNVFFVNGSDLNDAVDFQVTVPVGSTVLINVDGDSLSWSGGNTINGTNRTKVVYNFFEAYHLTVSNIGVLGTILAPFAHLDFAGGVIEGQAIVYSCDGPGQYNMGRFEGEVNFATSSISSDCEVTIKRILTGFSFNISPKFHNRSGVWAGTFLGYVNGHSTEFFCVDFTHPLQFHKGYDFDEIVSGPIRYITNNYYPSIEHTGTNGQLSDKRKEAAAIQAAVWHFSDGFNPAHITRTDIKNRALEIVADATGKNPAQIKHFEVLPASQVKMDGAQAEFTVVARDALGNALPDVDVLISTTAGTLSAEEGTTDAAGRFTFTLTQGGGDNAEITITTYDGVIPGGTRYVRPGKQTLVTNKPVITCLTTTATANWIDEPLPGSLLSFFNYNMTNSELPENYIVDVAATKKQVIAGTHSSGLAIYDRDADEWEVVNDLPVNAVKSVYIITNVNDYKEDGVAGLVNQGFVYHDYANDTTYHYNSTNSDFAGNTVNEATSFVKGGKKYLALAHDTGVSLFDLDDKTFTNINASTSNFPSASATCITVDGGKRLWVGTPHGLAKSDDLGVNWTVYKAADSDIPGDIINSVAAKSNDLYVGFFNEGLAHYDISGDVWTDLAPYLSTYPVDDILIADNKVFVGNYSRGMYVYDGENFSRYQTVLPNGAPNIIEGIAFDNTDVWVATRSGISRTVSGVDPELGDAVVSLEDKTVPLNSTFTIELKLDATETLSINQLEGTLQYHPGQLEFISGTVGNLMNRWTVNKFEDENGVLKFRAKGNKKIKRSGTLWYLTFKVSPAYSGEGLSAIYLSNMTADYGNPLSHEDLGVIYITTAGTGNAGLGDANLDGNVDISDLHAVINHLTYGDAYELTGDGLANADVNEDSEVDNNDVSDIMYFLFNGFFPPSFPPPSAPGGQVSGGQHWFNEDGSQLFVPIEITPNGSIEGEGVFRNITFTFTYNSNVISFDAFTSALSETGNFTNAVELEPGKAQFTFASPFDLTADQTLGDIVLGFPGGSAAYNETITTTYTVDGSDEITGPTIVITPTDVKDVKVVPTEYELFSNYPNPFNPVTTIKFALPAEQNVSLKIYDILGREVRTLIQDAYKPGVYEMQWNGTNNAGTKVASGIYLYRFEAGEFVKTHKMIMLK